MGAYPSGHKILVSMEPMNGIHLAECDFTVNLFVNTLRKISIPKSKCIKQDEDSYICTFNTRALGRGNVMMSLNVHIPDSDFDEGFKDVNTEPICTGVADM